ncbi:hypothetical protein ACHAXS_003930 [Conticribra weissflogii]
MLSRSLFCLCGSLPTPPNKTLTYGVASHVFCDYFRIGTMLAYNCCANFYHIMAVCYQAKCLNASRANYLKSITKLHHHIHKCLVHLIEHTLFGKLSTSMARNTQRRVEFHSNHHITCSNESIKECYCTIVLEALCDYQTFFWHTSYGYPGTMNDMGARMSLKMSQVVLIISSGTR